MQYSQLTKTYFVAPQITVDDVAFLADAGFSTVICNRPDDEDPGQPVLADIAAACEAAGIECHHIPFAAMPLSISDVERARQLVEAASGKTLGYCRSGQRSAMIFEAGA